MSADEDSTSSPDDDPYDDTDILNSAGTDEITAHLAAAGELNVTQRSAQLTNPAPPTERKRAIEIKKRNGGATEHQTDLAIFFIWNKPNIFNVS